MKSSNNRVVHAFFSRREVRTFLFRFFLLFIGVEFLLYVLPPIPYQEWLASSVAGWYSIPVHEIWVGVAHGNFEITPSCTGFTSAALFLGLLFGFPSLPKRKEKWALLGVLLILILNYVRLLAVIWAGENVSLPAAETIHILSWFILSGIAFGMWFRILQHETREKNWRKIGKALLHASH
jgi:exosortase/archaeosortase family protein